MFIFNEDDLDYDMINSLDVVDLSLYILSLERECFFATELIKRMDNNYNKEDMLYQLNSIQLSIDSLKELDITFKKCSLKSEYVKKKNINRKK